MAFRYSKIKAVAARLIDRFGMDAILSSKNGGGDYPVRVVISEYLPQQRDGQFITWTDRKAILAANGLPAGVVPDPEAHRLIANQDMQIVTVTKTSPGGDDVIYELQVRR
jgi:hypothetical protein